MMSSACHETFMREALDDARAALAADEFPVGCVIVADGRIVARGNRQGSASPAGLPELEHAEIVALRRLAADPAAASIPTDRLTVYSTLEPCLMCYATLLVNGVRRIVYAYEDVMGGGTGLDLASLSPLYQEMRHQVQITGGVLRRESLALFDRFFRHNPSQYLHDTYLARYTLQQGHIPSDRSSVA